MEEGASRRTVMFSFRLVSVLSHTEVSLASLALEVRLLLFSLSAAWR